MMWRLLSLSPMDLKLCDFYYSVRPKTWPPFDSIAFLSQYKFMKPNKYNSEVIVYIFELVEVPV
jgi:hypothetical protein